MLGMSFSAIRDPSTDDSYDNQLGGVVVLRDRGNREAAALGRMPPEVPNRTNPSYGVIFNHHLRERGLLVRFDEAMPLEMTGRHIDKCDDRGARREVRMPGDIAGPARCHFVRGVWARP
ncbi:hypothetical protein GCM10010430_13470 [Kitasatospora cystarginea]|uniref:Uncharacterized protein n=1 Tax=Kitasatospora cystarginea TaxID=58350 RepID=A0ABN3DK80_9ACTN